MGKPSPLYDVDIVLPNGKSAAAGEVGEIVINTKNSIPCGLFKGYYNSEELTREAWHDGVYHMGDTATPLGKTRTAITGMSAGWTT